MDDARGAERLPDGRFPNGSGRPASGVPSRGYRWPPFEPGHTRTLHHGAASERTWRPLADAIAAELVEVAPWAAQPPFAASVAAWARQEARLQLVDGYLAERGLLDDDGNPRPATKLLQELERSTESLRARLALDPVSWSKLLGTLAASQGEGDDLDALRAVGRRILAARSEQPATTHDRKDPT